jgi:lysozyme
MQLSPAGLFNLKRFEGCRLEAYQDEGGVWTIGWGDTRGVTPGQHITQAEADRRLLARLAEFEVGVSKALTRAATQRQFDSLVSLAYNIGLGRSAASPRGPAGFIGSTLLHKFNAGDEPGAAEEFAKWIHVRGTISPNLVRRRFAELVHWFIG